MTGDTLEQLLECTQECGIIDGYLIKPDGSVDIYLDGNLLEYTLVDAQTKLRKLISRINPDADGL